MVIIGAMHSLRRNDDERLQLWPFPQTVPSGTDRATLWKQYRERMLSNAGVCIVLAGNKIVDGKVIPADGVRQEVDIARGQGKMIVPIGATGHIAKEIWQEINADLTKHYGSANVADSFATLDDASASPEKLVKATIDILKQLEK